jgi:hypothetical protein
MRLRTYAIASYISTYGHAKKKAESLIAWTVTLYEEVFQAALRLWGSKVCSCVTVTSDGD